MSNRLQWDLNWGHSRLWAYGGNPACVGAVLQTSFPSNHLSKGQNAWHCLPLHLQLPPTLCWPINSLTPNVIINRHGFAQGSEITQAVSLWELLSSIMLHRLPRQYLSWLWNLLEEEFTGEWMAGMKKHPKHCQDEQTRGGQPVGGLALSNLMEQCSWWKIFNCQVCISQRT